MVGLQGQDASSWEASIVVQPYDGDCEFNDRYVQGESAGLALVTQDSHQNTM